MGWWRFWDKDSATTDASQAEEPVRPSASGRGPRRPVTRTTTDPALERRTSELRRRRDALVFDIDQGELAQQPENPWRERIDLLSEAITNVEADIEALDSASPIKMPPLDPTPIRDIVATGSDLVHIGFAIGAERFAFEELADWDQRGGAVVRGDLRSVAGDVASLVPPAFPVDVRRALHDHLVDSVAVFATDLRDRSLSDESMPSDPTLADLARPCPKCGGWMDWSGRCPACTARATERQRLRSEAQRFDDERRAEADAQHQLADGLPVTRRRLAAVESDLRSLGVDMT